MGNPFCVSAQSTQRRAGQMERSNLCVESKSMPPRFFLPTAVFCLSFPRAARFAAEDFGFAFRAIG